MQGPRNRAFDGLWLPLVTPMRNGRIDLGAARSLARRYQAAGVGGLVIFGSTGEGNLLSDSERAGMVLALRDVPEPLPLVAGVGGVSTQDVATAVHRLEVLDLAGYLVPPPYYLGPSQEGIVWHYRQVAAAARRPLIVYNVPKRTGVAITLQTLEELTGIPQVAAVKECDPMRLRELNARSILPTLCGDDEAFLEHFLAGGAGAIPASAHIRPDLFVAVMRRAREGDAAAARALFDPLRPLIRLLFAEPNPAPVKRALALQGLVADELRLPLTPASPALGEQLRQQLERLASEVPA